MKQAFLGIDVSKGYADLLLLDANKEVLEEPFQLQDNKEGRSQLKHLIEQWFQQGIEQLCCGVESTGGYENNWYGLLKGYHKEGRVQTARLNARAVKAVSDAVQRRTITDSVSAQNIALYLIGFPEKIDYGTPQQHPSERPFKEGRQQLSYLSLLQKQKVQLSNQLEKLLYQYFSELLVYCRHGQPLWLLTLLSLYPCAEMLKKAGVSRLTKIRGISEGKAKSLLGKAASSQSAASADIQHLIKVTASEVLHKEGLLKAQKAYLSDAYRAEEQVKLLDTIPGIGVETAVALVLEIEDISRFCSSKKLAAYFGLHPIYKQSGDGLWAGHLSKKGRSGVRSVLYMAALSAVRCHPLFKGIYARFRAKGMKHKAAMGVVMHKLLRIIYGVLKHHKPFEAAVDENNQQRAQQKQQQREQQTKEQNVVREVKKHRFQPVVLEAPISRRTAQKRKKQQASQTS